jgi:xanthomonalisin
MTPSQLAADYLPTQAQVRAVTDYLRSAGFGNIRVSPNRMIVNASGSAGTVQSAFRTTLVGVRTHDGRDAFANSSAIRIPAALQDTVQAVLGLQSVHVAHTMARGATPALDPVTGHNPLEFASIYKASGLAPATDINAAVWGWGSMASTLSDLNVYTSDNGLSSVNAGVVCTDYNGYNQGGVSTTDPTCNSYDQGSTEWDLDSQDIVAMSGGVKSLTFYAAYGGYNSSITNALNEIVTPTAGEPLAQVINASFGECERYEDSGQNGDGSAQADDALFQIAAAQGQTFSVSTGDSGSDECGDGGLNSASYPASSPWVVAVSGTTLYATTTSWGGEAVWRRAGGSPSSFEVAQPWQTNLTYGTYAGMRGPDVAFDANPNSGAIIYDSAAGGYVQVGGTSLSAPIFAGAWARILQRNPGLGFAAPQLYTLRPFALHDVKYGNNRGYNAQAGWDWATGLGSFKVGLAAFLLRNN